MEVQRDGATTAHLQRIPLHGIPYDPEKIEAGKEYVAKKLGITLKEFEEILNSPPKSYKDYPNNEKKLKFIYGVYKRYFSDL